MKHFKVLGSGCKNCETTAQLIKNTALESNTTIKLEKVTDMAQIMGYGVMSTPGVVIDETVVHAGGIPSSEQVRQWLSE